MGNKFLQQLQIGQEATAGTAVTPTARWRGPAVMPDDQRTIVFPDEDIGSLPGKDRSYIPMLKSAVALPETEATFEQLGYIFMAGIEDQAGVKDGDGTDYVYTYDPPTTSQPAVTFIKTLSLTGGDNQEQEQMEYCFVKDFVIKGRYGEAVMVSANLVGRKNALDDFETISLPSVEEILTQKGKVYIDAVDGSVGGTQITNTITQFELRVKTGWSERFTADGNLYFSFAKFGRPEMELDLTFEHDSTAVAQKVLWRAETSRLVRLFFEGSSVATGGTTYSKKTLIMDFAGKWSYVAPPETDGENTIQRCKFMVRENDTASLYSQFVLVNELSAHP